MWRIRYFISSVKNLIRWFPIIWKDRDWDDWYIWEILKFKIKNQAEGIGTRRNYVGVERDVEKMLLCVKLIERIQEEYYGLEYMDYFDSDYNWIDSSIPGHKELEIITNSERFDEYFKKYPLIYRMVPDLNASKSKIAFQIAKINEERAYKLLFKILEQNIRRWWD